MSTTNFIAAGIIIIAAVVIIGIRIYKNSKNGVSYDMDSFITEFGDNIITTLKDTIDVLSMNLDNYETKDEYETEIIKYTIEAIKNNAGYFGFDETVVNLFDTEALTSIVKKVFCDNKCDVMSILSADNIAAHANIIDEEVVDVIGTEVVDEQTTDNENV